MTIFPREKKDLNVSPNLHHSLHTEIHLKQRNLSLSAHSGGNLPRGNVLQKSLGMPGLKGKTMGCNRTDSLQEENLPPRVGNRKLAALSLR